MYARGKRVSESRYPHTEVPIRGYQRSTLIHIPLDSNVLCKLYICLNFHKELGYHRNTCPKYRKNVIVQNSLYEPVRASRVDEL